MNVSLRLFLLAITTLICLCGAITGATFWYSNHSTRLATEALVDSIESVAIVQDLQQNLAIHRRQALLKGIRTASERKFNIDLAEEKLKSEIDQIFFHVDTPEENELAQQVKSAIISYIELYKTLRSQSVTGPELYQRVTDEYEKTQEGIQRLIQLNLLQTQEIEDSVRHQNRIGTISTTSTLFLLLTAMALLLLGFRHLLYKPILNLKRKIDAFEIGMPVAGNSKLSGAREVQDIFTSFIEMSQRLRQQNEERLRFLGAISHDLKNPLAAIQMSADILGQDETVHSDQKTLLSIVSRQSQHLNRLVGDLLDTTRIESGKMSFAMTTFDLSKTVREAALLYKNTSDRHFFEFDFPKDPVVVYGDEQRITQVVNNLMSNAIKYSPSGGRISIQVKVDGDRVFTSVSDSGLGIDSNDLESIFKPFQRSAHTKDTIPGVGLGLSVAKKIMKAHPRGDLTVTSQLGIGSTFTIVLERKSKV